MPKLINTYQHVAMSLLRRYVDDLPLQEWFEKDMAHRKAHDASRHVGALLTAVEFIASGNCQHVYYYTLEENEGESLCRCRLKRTRKH